MKRARAEEPSVRSGTWILLFRTSCFDLEILASKGKPSRGILERNRDRKNSMSIRILLVVSYMYIYIRFYEQNYKRARARARGSCDLRDWRGSFCARAHYTRYTIQAYTRADICILLPRDSPLEITATSFRSSILECPCISMSLKSRDREIFIKFAPIAGRFRRSYLIFACSFFPLANECLPPFPLNYTRVPMEFRSLTYFLSNRCQTAA